MSNANPPNLLEYHFLSPNCSYIELDIKNTFLHWWSSWRSNCLGLLLRGRMTWQSMSSSKIFVWIEVSSWAWCLVSLELKDTKTKNLRPLKYFVGVEVKKHQIRNLLIAKEVCSWFTYWNLKTSWTWLTSIIQLVGYC